MEERGQVSMPLDRCLWGIQGKMDVQQAAAYIGLEVGEGSGMENHTGLSPPRQGSGSIRLCRDSVGSEKAALDRTLRGTTFEGEAKEKDPTEEMRGEQEDPGQCGISELKGGESAVSDAPKMGRMERIEKCPDLVTRWISWPLGSSR